MSIVVPSYNRLDMLKECVESVLGQTYKDWELVIVDNSSEDGTKEFLKSITSERIRSCTVNNDGIIAVSRNVGIRMARGIYIAFLDSDDFWFEQKLSACVKRLERGAGLVCHSENWVREGRIIRQPAYKKSKVDYSRLLTRGNCLSTSAVVVRRDLLLEAGLFNEDKSLVLAEDYDLWIRLAKKRTEIRLINDVLGVYRVHTGASSKSKRKSLEATTNVVVSHMKGGKYGIKTLMGILIRLVVLQVQRVAAYIC